MTTRRWHKAQSSERAWWRSRAAAMDLDFYAVFARAMRRELDGILTPGKDTRVLEIGSAAAGILTHLGECSERHAVDPLEEFYASEERFRAYRDPAVHYHAGTAANFAPARLLQKRSPSWPKTRRPTAGDPTKAW